MDEQVRRKSKGGRPKGDPLAVRGRTIGVRVSPAEYAQLCAKAEHLGMTPAHFLRAAALSRRLPAPAVPAANREQYAELARLAANLNQLTRLANKGRPVVVREELLQQIADQLRWLRLALVGLESDQ